MTLLFLSPGGAARGLVKDGEIVWCAAFTPDGKAVALTHQSAGVTFRDKQDGCIKVVLKPWG